jgi:hypothetical protein
MQVAITTPKILRRLLAVSPDMAKVVTVIACVTPV